MEWSEYVSNAWRLDIRESGKVEVEGMTEAGIIIKAEWNDKVTRQDKDQTIWTDGRLIDGGKEASHLMKKSKSAIASILNY
jgi:hypothetical protein